VVRQQQVGRLIVGNLRADGLMRGGRRLSDTTRRIELERQTRLTWIHSLVVQRNPKLLSTKTGNPMCAYLFQEKPSFRDSGSTPFSIFAMRRSTTMPGSFPEDDEADYADNSEVRYVCCDQFSIRTNACSNTGPGQDDVHSSTGEQEHDSVQDALIHASFDLETRSYRTDTYSDKSFCQGNSIEDMAEASLLAEDRPRQSGAEATPATYGTQEERSRIEAVSPSDDFESFRQHDAEHGQSGHPALPSGMPASPSVLEADLTTHVTTAGCSDTSHVADASSSDLNRFKEADTAALCTLVQSTTSQACKAIDSTHDSTPAVPAQSGSDAGTAMSSIKHLALGSHPSNATDNRPVWLHGLPTDHDHGELVDNTRYKLDVGRAKLLLANAIDKARRIGALGSRCDDSTDATNIPAAHPTNRINGRSPKTYGSLHATTKLNTSQVSLNEEGSVSTMVCRRCQAHNHCASSSASLMDRTRGFFRRLQGDLASGLDAGDNNRLPSGVALGKRKAVIDEDDAGPSSERKEQKTWE
jgi:hypothetical protein